MNSSEFAVAGLTVKSTSDLDDALFVDHTVPGGEISVYELAGRQVSHAVGYLTGHLQHLRHAERLYLLVRCLQANSAHIKELITSLFQA